MKEVRLLRKVALEERTAVPDGAGGWVYSWEQLGVHWADIRGGGGGEAYEGDRQTARASHVLTVHASRPGSPSRPRPDQRFRDGAQIYEILSVSEIDSAGRYLACTADRKVDQ